MKYNIFDKNNYVVHVKALKLVLEYRLILEKVRRVIKFYLETWLNPWRDINT